MTTQRIQVLTAVEAIRSRPAMYIGPPEGEQSACRRLVEAAVDMFATAVPMPAAVRLIAWDRGSFTLSFDGESLPIAPSMRASPGVPHPDLYAELLSLMPTSTRFPGMPAVVVNALSERMTVGTEHDGERYTASFRRGALVSLLSKCVSAPAHAGSSWLTFRPDEAVVPGTVTVDDARRIVERVAARTSAALSLVDRTDEEPEWWR